MSNRNSRKPQERRFKDSIFTDDGEVQLGNLSPKSTISIGGRKIKVSDIPWSVFVMACGHRDKGLAVSIGTVIFCEKCRTKQEIKIIR